MSQLLTKMMGRGLSFAHLGKVPSAARGARAADDPDPDDDSGKGKKSKRAEGDDPDDDPDDDGQNRDDGDSKKGKKASEDDPDPDDDSGKGKKGKRAEDDDPDDDTSAEDDDDDEEEMRGKSAAASARRRERARCAAIMACRGAARNPVMAANLAFKTSMTRQEAIATLADAPAPAASQAPRRSNPNLGAGGESTPNSSKAIQDGWDRSFARARGGR